MNSADLLERFRQGDPGAADALFARYVERLTQMARWHLSDLMQRRIDPEDAVQSAYRSFFIRARQGQFSLERSGDLWRLLVGITLNKLHRQIAHHRARKRSVALDRPLAQTAFRSIASADPSPLEAMMAADELQSLMAVLTPLQRQVLELRLQDCRWDQIATATGCSERTVRRALEQIRITAESLLFRPAADETAE